MRKDTGGRARKSRRVSRGAGQAVRIFRRRGDESDGREGKSESDQRHPARETGRLTGRGLRNIVGCIPLLPFDFSDAFYKFVRIVGSNDNRSNKTALLLYEHAVSPEPIAKLKHGCEFPKLQRRTLFDFPYVSNPDCHARNKSK